MAKEVTLKPAQKPIKQYYASLQAFREQNVSHEQAIRAAFQRLLEDAAKPRGWVVVAELRDKIHGKTIIPDATIRDQNNLPRGHWESKDSKDDLELEISKKLEKGYPDDNIIFEDSQQAILYQNGRLALRADLSVPQQLCDVLNLFFAHAEPAIEDFEKAVAEFKERVPDLACGLDDKIKNAHAENPVFQEAFDSFFDVCQRTLNPNLREDAVDEMLIQHLLTERLIRTIFDNPEFAGRNAVAAEIEKVIAALVSRSFNRKEFLASLDRFYAAIEAAAAHLTSFTEKQHFLNSIYERFFQGYSVKAADTMGIVYTPQPIVDFMCESVKEVLEKEFGKSLADPDVLIIDPCTGTGNFIANLMRRVPKKDLPGLYRERLFANEVMLLPYYIASLNIEHAYYELTGNYEPFDGLCFVDTLELAEAKQRKLEFMAEKNTERVERQRKAPITVVIGNPPYNVGQLNENDNNKNRRYPAVEERVRSTYAADSKASNKNALSDAYVKFFRWSVDRLEGRDGIVCLVTNNSFVDQIAFDGMRKHLLADFTRFYHVDLHGNVRKNPKLSGTTHNVFGIQVGVGITVAVRSNHHKGSKLFYNRVAEDWRKEQKLGWLSEKAGISSVKWKATTPNEKFQWIAAKGEDEFAKFLPLGSKETKAEKAPEALFHLLSNGVNTSRDSMVYGYERKNLIDRIKNFVENYNAEVDRFRRAGGKSKVKNLDDFVNYEKVKWSEGLKANAVRGRYAEFSDNKIRVSLYRPFNKQFIFFDGMLIERTYVLPRIFPVSNSEKENSAICVTNLGSDKPFMVMAANTIADYHLVGAGASTQCFPFYTYDEDGGNRRENVTDWALEEFRGNYKDKKIGKRDIFHYVYGVLHHPQYREKFGGCLKRELPRVPFAPDFWAFAEAGKRLMELHLGYEEMAPYKLQWIEAPNLPQSLRVEDKMRLSPDKQTLKVNPSLSLGGIPAETFEYRLGNRSALEWVIDQYQVKKDERTGQISDPNRYGPEDYIVNLIGCVIAVSLETVKIVNGLPSDFGG